MNEADQQRFIAEVALYKAMRGEDDAMDWLDKVQPLYTTSTLTEWRIRDAILHQHWQRIVQLIDHTPLEDTQTWQYWLARAYEAIGEKDKAKTRYHALGMKRHYYGFLANIR